MNTQLDNLKHYGIPGMRWGVRNDRKSSGNNRSSSTKKAKPLSKMTNEEIQKAVTRMNLEQQYNRLSPKTKTQQAVGFTARLTGTIVVGAITSVGTKLAVKGIKFGLNKVTGMVA